MSIPTSVIALVRGVVKDVQNSLDPPQFTINGVTVYYYQQDANPEIAPSPGMSLIVQIDLNACTAVGYHAITMAPCKPNGEHRVGIPATGGLPIANLLPEEDGDTVPIGNVIGILPRPRDSRKSWLIVSHAIQGGTFDETMVPVNPTPIYPGERVWSDGNHYYIGKEDSPPSVHIAREIFPIHM